MTGRLRLFTSCRIQMKTSPNRTTAFTIILLVAKSHRRDLSGAFEAVERGITVGFGHQSRRRLFRPNVVTDFLCGFRLLLLSFGLLFSPLDEHRAFQRSPADTGVDGNLTLRFLLYLLFPSTRAGMSTVPSSPTHKDKTFYWLGLIDS